MDSVALSYARFLASSPSTLTSTSSSGSQGHPPSRQHAREPQIFPAIDGSDLISTTSTSLDVSDVDVSETSGSVTRPLLVSVNPLIGCSLTTSGSGSGSTATFTTSGSGSGSGSTATFTTSGSGSGVDGCAISVGLGLGVGVGSKIMLIFGGDVFFLLSVVGLSGETGGF